MEQSKMLVKASQLNTRTAPYLHPTYRFSKVVPLSGVQTATIGAQSGNETTFEIPINAINLARSYLTFQFSIPADAGGASFNMIYSDTCPFIRQIQLYTRSGIYLCDIDQLQNYLKVVWNPETNLNDFLTFTKQSTANVALANPNASAGTIGSGSLFARNNLINSDNGAKRPTQGTNNASISYTEPVYYITSAAVNQITTANYRLPLGLIYNTILSLDKDLYFGEVLVLRIVWGARTKVAYLSTLAAGNVDAGPAAALASDVAVSDLTLYVAVEKDLDILNDLMAQKQKGMNVIIPYLYYYKYNAGNAIVSQNVSLRFNRGHGMRLKKIYHSAFNTTETSNTAYDHSNLNGSKIVKYYTLLNNNRLQEWDLDCTKLDDYNIMREKLKGSVIQNGNVYQYNWFHLEDFTGFYSNDEKDESNLESGLPLNMEQKWDIFTTTAGNGVQLNHYSFAITDKVLSISSAGISVV